MDVQGDTTSLVTGLHRNTVSSYNAIWRGVGGVLDEDNNCLKEALGRELRILQ